MYKDGSVASLKLKKFFEGCTILQVFVNHKASRSLYSNPVQAHYVFMA